MHAAALHAAKGEAFCQLDQVTMMFSALELFAPFFNSSWPGLTRPPSRRASASRF